MHRFGRSAPRNMKDRWGGGFILATILALFAAWYVGDFIGKKLGTENTAGPKPGTVTGINGNNSSTVSSEPKQFDMYLVRVGVFASPANARGVVSNLYDAGYTPVMGPEENKVTPVYVGPFMDKQSAEDAKLKLQAVKADYKDSFIRQVTVHYNPAAVPAAAMGAKDADLKSSLDSLNMYIQEVAYWLETRSIDGTADTAGIEGHGRTLGDLATTLSGNKDAQVTKYANVAALASQNAMTLAAVADKDANSPEFQAAMVEYMGLVNQYRTLQAGK